MTLPNFFIVGAAKAGTTALYHYLRRHPDIFMSPWKEPKYFAFSDPAELDFAAPDGRAPVIDSTVLDREQYEGLFAAARHEAVRGEASSIYLYVEQSAARIKACVPEARCVAILRNPIDRAFSSYQHLRREGREPLSFSAALDAEPQRIAQRYGFLWRYTDLGFYDRQVQRFTDVFGQRQLLLLLYDDLVADPRGTCQRVFEFLGVDPSFWTGGQLQVNRSGVPRSRFVHVALNPPTPFVRRVWDRTPRWARERLLVAHTRMTNANLRRQVMSPADRARLVEVFRAEVGRLERRLDRDLSHWLA